MFNVISVLSRTLTAVTYPIFLKSGG